MGSDSAGGRRGECKAAAREAGGAADIPVGGVGRNTDTRAARGGGIGDVQTRTGNIVSAAADFAVVVAAQADDAMASAGALPTCMGS